MNDESDKQDPTDSSAKNPVTSGPITPEPTTSGIEAEVNENSDDNASIVDFTERAEAQKHQLKAQRMGKMRERFESFLPINKESRQVKRRKARKKKKKDKK